MSNRNTGPESSDSGPSLFSCQFIQISSFGSVLKILSVVVFTGKQDVPAVYISHIACFRRISFHVRTSKSVRPFCFLRSHSTNSEGANYSIPEVRFSSLPFGIQIRFHAFRSFRFTVCRPSRAFYFAACRSARNSGSAACRHSRYSGFLSSPAGYR